MSKAAVMESAPIRLPIPTELSTCRAWCEIEATVAAQVQESRINCCRRLWAVAWLICMWNGQVFMVSTIANSYINWSTWIIIVVVYAVHPLIRMYLQDQNTAQQIYIDQNKRQHNSLWCKFTKHIFMHTKGVNWMLESNTQVLEGDG